MNFALVVLLVLAILILMAYALSHRPLGAKDVACRVGFSLTLPFALMPYVFIQAIKGNILVSFGPDPSTGGYRLKISNKHEDEDTGDA